MKLLPNFLPEFPTLIIGKTTGRYLVFGRTPDISFDLKIQIVSLDRIMYIFVGSQRDAELIAEVLKKNSLPYYHIEGEGGNPFKLEHLREKGRIRSGQISHYRITIDITYQKPDFIKAVEELREKYGYKTVYFYYPMGFIIY